LKHYPKIEPIPINKIVAKTLFMEKSKKTTLELIGLGTRFRIFFEIARHPQGLTATDLKTKVGITAKSMRYHLRDLEDTGFISTDYGKSNGKIEASYKISEKGIESAYESMRSVCEVISAVSEERTLFEEGVNRGFQRTKI